MENKKIKITIPCHWNLKILDEIIKVNKDAKTPVVEIYGALANGGPLGHGRSPDSVVSVTREEAKKFREKCRHNGISFTYLLNAPFTFDKNSTFKKELDEYLDWIINDFKADALTISSHELMRYIRNKYPNISIHISTIAGICNKKDLEKFLDIKPSRVVPHHNVGKTWKELKEIIDLGKENNFEVELLSTESCLFGCPNRMAHYEYLAKASKDNPFHTNCNSQKLIDPSELLMAGGMVRPEDINLYANMGVKYIKLSGRSKPTEWLPEVVKAYQTNNYDGNLIRLLGVDPSMHAEEWMFLNNQSLQGFLKKLPQNNVKMTKEYCQKWMCDLYRQGNFKLSDGTTYKEMSGTLVLDKLGFKTSQIINKEKI